jgi:hypothetical protein
MEHPTSRQARTVRYPVWLGSFLAPSLRANIPGRIIISSIALSPGAARTLGCFLLVSLLLFIQTLDCVLISQFLSCRTIF